VLEHGTDGLEITLDGCRVCLEILIGDTPFVEVGTIAGGGGNVAGWEGKRDGQVAEL
jgi:hypothetical protein